MAGGADGAKKFITVEGLLAAIALNHYHAIAHEGF
jgi:hypothetical protein